MRSTERASIGAEVDQRLLRLQLSFNDRGFDAFGVSREALRSGMRYLGWLYRHYFSVTCRGLHHLPARGRVMLVGNHSGGYAIDASMVIAACFFEPDPPRLVHGMAARFVNRVPVLSRLANRTGQITGSPQVAKRLLADERALLVFPEGTRGTQKLYWNRYTLVDFTVGFARLAMTTQTPIVPFAFFGGGEALPTIANFTLLGKLFGVPYVPITPYLLPLPLPTRAQIHFSAPLRLEGSGDEPREAVKRQVERVRAAIRGLIDAHRPVSVPPPRLPPPGAEGESR